MGNILESFISHCQQENLTVLYAQVRQGGEVTGQWSRFGKGSGNGFSAFAGISRFESYSLAKSFSAIGVGIALDDGLIRLDEKVSDSFKEFTYAINDPRVLDVTVEDMLKMASGLEKPLFFRDSPERAIVKDWIEYFYEQGKFTRPRGQEFLYSNFNTYMLGCLVERKAGCNLLEYMRYRLFEPLGIGNPDMTMCPKSHTVAANGLAINVDELGRFGQMICIKGCSMVKRMVGLAFVKAARRSNSTSV
jgi:CubicO group peptidase (beta-lactamase class C family)